MNRKMVLQITAPAVLIGLLLLGGCIASVISINRLQRNLADILTEDVTSLEAAQELEIRLRQLRFHWVIFLMDPQPERRSLIEADQAGFETSLEKAILAANTPKEIELVEAIQSGYKLYRSELEHSYPIKEGKVDIVHWVNDHPIRHLLDPCQELLRVNKAAMEQAAAESESVSTRARNSMIILGILGPISGLISGYGIARGLSRSIARLIVRLQDVQASLNHDVASVHLTHGKPSSDLDRQMDWVVSRVREVAEQVQRHQWEILRAEQLAAVGQLAASVAHEVRNPLTSIKLLVGAALKADNQTPLSVEDLQVIHQASVRLEQSIQAFLDFARPPKVRREMCDLREVIGQAVELVRGRANQQHVALQVGQPDQPVRGDADRSLLGTVLVNLMMNALDAMPKGGKLQVILEAASENTIRLAVRDSGPGISDSVAARLFTPFVSTKATGTGLGLSICRRIVQEHGGTITGANLPDRGTEFLIQLPAAGPCFV